MKMHAPRKPFTGRHMTAILVAGFGVVVAVNFTMAGLASLTFGGVVVENSYVASQHFNRWLDEAEKEKALGWRIEARWRSDGRVTARIDGPAAATGTAFAAAKVTATARHPLGRLADVPLTFRRDESGEWVSTGQLPAGRWTLRFDVEGGGRSWRTQQPISAGEAA
ncbi:FixH family protein [Novosphingobium sp. P6W]|uniref:FixH family protein n=1 Tax=Novosphingobium sp. P6W TaxID=1609758 RepID=UPI0005C30DD1|nr:FixH family protein [Novosphingobium sp. P6W]KIS30500.1 membrane protein [Novosphingobium sp. P6W]